MNQLYRHAAELLLTGQVNWNTAAIRPWLVDSAYVFNPAHVLFSSSVPVSARAAQGPLLLTGKSVTGGVLRAMNYTFGEVPGRPRLGTAIVFVLDASDKLFLYLDTGFGLPMTFNGAEVILTPDEAMGGFYRA